MDNPEILYKGSPAVLSELIPEPVQHTDVRRLQSLGLKVHTAICATDLIQYALPYAALNGSVNWSIHVSKEPRIVITIQIDDIDWKSKLDLDKEVYLYSVSSEKFKKVDDFKYVSLENVPIIDKKAYRVGDILKKYEVYVPQVKEF